MPIAGRTCRAALGALALTFMMSCGRGDSPAPSAATARSGATVEEQHDAWATQGYTCVSCHPCGKRGGHPAGWSDPASSGFHAFAANQGLDGCTSCHGATLDGGTASACGRCHDQSLPAGVATWKVSCTMCHGGVDDASGAPPKATWGNASDPMRTGAHGSHRAAGVGCASCHPVPADALAPGHVDASVNADVKLPGIAGGPAPQWDRTTGTCTSTSCHGLPGGSIPAPSWTTVGQGQAACGTCHGLPPPAPHSGNPACGNCHDGYTATSVNPQLHASGAVETLPFTCVSCHGSTANAAPPLGTHGENETSARAVGAHQSHVLGATLGRPLACEECHPARTAMDHADGIVQVEFGPLSATGGLVPVWDRETQTCSNNYCHGTWLRGGGGNQAPIWNQVGTGQAACGTCHLTPPPAPHVHTQLCENCHPGYTITSVNPALHLNGVIDAENLTCSSCHGDDSRVLVARADPLAIAAPPFGTQGERDATSRSVGAHQAHVSRGDGIAVPNRCSFCHAVPDPADPAAMRHSNGVAEVRFDKLATMGGAVPVWNGQTCENTYCHGATLNRGGTSHAPTWLDPASAACGTCHGVPPPAPHPQETDCVRCHPGYTATTVRQSTHVNGVSDFPSGCNSCHDIPPDTGRHYDHLQSRIACAGCHQGYTTTSENPTLHRNARQDVTVPGWNPTTRSCGSNSCHGGRYWGQRSATSNQCNDCHGLPPASGEHFEHSEYGCDRCHGAGYSRTTVNVSTHMNGTVNVSLAFYDRTRLSCGYGTGSCHGSKPWGARGTVTTNCGNCHGYPPPGPHPQGQACYECHSSMTTSGTLTADHNNGTLNLTRSGCSTCHGFPPATTRAGHTHPSDANCYGCHSTTVDAQNQVKPDGSHNDGVVNVGGGGVGTYGCQACHGDPARPVTTGLDPNVKAAPPIGTRGETTTDTRAVGAHLAHVAPGAAAVAAPLACADCHVVPAAMDHASGTVIVTFGGLAAAAGATPAWDPATDTCATTYCHGATLAGGTAKTPAWTLAGAGQDACDACHGAPPPAPHPDAALAGCTGCHPDSVDASGAAKPPPVGKHLDGVVQGTQAAHGAAWTDPASPGFHASSANAGLGACTGCHGPALDGIGLAPSCGSCHDQALPAGVTTWKQDCVMCHGGADDQTGAPPKATWGNAADTIRVGAHTRHVTYGCATCHVVPPDALASGHVDGGTAELVFGGLATADAAAASWSRTAGTCTVYCHGATLAGGTRTAPLWTGGAAEVTCGSCHGLPPPAPHSTSTACGSCHAGYTASTVNATTHADGVVQYTTTCSSCHGSGTSTAASPRLAAPPKGTKGETATTTRAVGAHAAHLDGGTLSNPMACSECHAVPATMGHQNGAAAITWGTLAKARSSLPSWSTSTLKCSNVYCHGAKLTGGSNRVPSWVTVNGTQDACGTCHGRPPTSGHHSKHTSYGCAVCHGGTYTSSVADKTRHVNGVYDLNTTSLRWSATSRSCAPSCHSTETW